MHVNFYIGAVHLYNSDWGSGGRVSIPALADSEPRLKRITIQLPLVLDGMLSMTEGTRKHLIRGLQIAA